MGKIPDITSTSNEKVAWLRSLHKSSKRREFGVFVVEGAKEVNFALEAGLNPHSIYLRSSGYDKKLTAKFVDIPQFSLSPTVFERIVYRESEPGGIVAVFETPKFELSDIKLSEKPFLIIVETVEKPGNLGAILRIADGAGADAVVVCGESVDIYNPNVIRSSVGCVFSKMVVSASNQEVKNFCDKHGIKLFGAAITKEAMDYEDCEYNQPIAIILGSEAKGLSDFWLKNSRQIIIPMKGRNDSLNVSAAAAVLAYEVLRQRAVNPLRFHQ